MPSPSSAARHHVSFNLPVVATGVAGVWQIAANQPARNFEIVASPGTQVAISLLFVLAAALVIVGWSMFQSDCPLTRDRGLRIKASGLVGWSVGMLAYLAANWGLWSTSDKFFTSPATWIIAAMIPTMLHRAWLLLRPVRGVA